MLSTNTYSKAQIKVHTNINNTTQLVQRLNINALSGLPLQAVKEVETNKTIGIIKPKAGVSSLQLA